MHSIPHVYINCGHVHGYHSWGESHAQNENLDENDRICPICREVYFRFVLNVFFQEMALFYCIFYLCKLCFNYENVSI